MKTFRKTFEIAEANSRYLLTEWGFTLSEISITEPTNRQYVFGSANFLEALPNSIISSSRKFIKLSVAPLRLELDLEFGRDNKTYSIHELHNLDGISSFPERTHDLYEAMHDEIQLGAEFERLIKALIECGSRFKNQDETLWTNLINQRLKVENLKKKQTYFSGSRSGL